MRANNLWGLGCLALLVWPLNGCTVKAVGDPKRPITIEAHITLDVRELKSTAADIEDYVSGATPKEKLPVKQGDKK